MSRVTIVDTGVANLASITAAFGRLGVEVERTSEAEAVRSAERLVLPGVGHFAAGRRALAERGLDEAVGAAVAAGTPLLGVCLGYQLLTEGSDEAPDVPGLGLLPGRCVRLPAEARVPHLGWSWIEASGLHTVAPGWAAFAHSYAVPAAAGGPGTAVTRHGTAFVAAVERGSVTGCQFHPELSGTWGQALLARWLGRAAAEANGSPATAGGGRRADRVARRVLPCLDVRGGRIVKGVRFAGLRDAGDPAERAAEYERQGADEIVILDVSASIEERRTAEDTVRRVRNVLGIPLTVGGGVRAVEDAARLLTAGADKISVNTAAVERPELLTELAREFGEQCVVLAIDARRESDDWEVLTHGGRQPRDLRAVAWAEEGWQRGAGEILLTSWDRDGTGEGCDEELLRAVSDRVGVPVIASGGVGRPEHAVGALAAGADAVLAASILHDGKDTVAGLKRAMSGAGFEVRP